MEEKLPQRKATARKAGSAKNKPVLEEKLKAKENEVVVPEEKTQLAANDLITVMNNTTGRYGYIGRSGYSFELEEYGDTAQVPFGELQLMRSSSQKRHLEEAFIIILNDDAVAQLNYTKLYEHVLDGQSVEELLSQPHRLEETLSKMPLAMRETVTTIAKQKYMNRTLFDIRVIEAIEKSLNVKIIE